MRPLSYGEDVICTAPNGGRLAGSVLHIFENGRVLVELGRPGAEHYLRDVRAFDANKVARA